jgi:F-box protein, helicase, 18
MKELNLTEEQKAILATNTDIAVNAVAGSGKTSTMIEYAASRPAGSRILYLAFNKSVKLEAVRKFAERGLNNVTVETAHSLAYRYIMRGNKYILSSQGYKTHQIAEVLSLTGDGARHTEFILANHISKFITYFCNSDKAKVQDLNYLDTVKEANAKKFVHSFYRVIEEGTRHFLAKMDKAEIEITHDFYLKKFQLSAPVLPYDYILFDEGQDASAAMLDVFLKQPAVKVIVGDTLSRFMVGGMRLIHFRRPHLPP